jgi:hypothetical protein
MNKKSDPAPYMTVADAAKKWGCSSERVRQWLKVKGRIPGAIKLSRDWLIPSNANRPKILAPGRPKKGEKI